MNGLSCGAAASEQTMLRIPITLALAERCAGYYVAVHLSTACAVQCGRRKHVPQGVLMNKDCTNNHAVPKIRKSSTHAIACKSTSTRDTITDSTKEECFQAPLTDAARHGSLRTSAVVIIVAPRVVISAIALL